MNTVSTSKSEAKQH